MLHLSVWELGPQQSTRNNGHPAPESSSVWLSSMFNFFIVVLQRKRNLCACLTDAVKKKKRKRKANSMPYYAHLHTSRAAFSCSLSASSQWTIPDTVLILPPRQCQGVPRSQRETLYAPSHIISTLLSFGLFSKNYFRHSYRSICFYINVPLIVLLPAHSRPAGRRSPRSMLQSSGLYCADTPPSPPLPSRCQLFRPRTRAPRCWSGPGKSTCWSSWRLRRRALWWRRTARPGCGSRRRSAPARSRRCSSAPCPGTAPPTAGSPCGRAGCRPDSDCAGPSMTWACGTPSNQTREKRVKSTSVRSGSGLAVLKLSVIIHKTCRSDFIDPDTCSHPSS